MKTTILLSKALTLTFCLWAVIPQALLAQTFTEHDLALNVVEPFMMRLGDMNGDGHLDMVSFRQGNYSTNGHYDIIWWENDGNQNFTDHLIEDYEFKWPASPNQLTLGDLNGDGHIDILADSDGGTLGDPEFTWYKNNGDETFTLKTIFTGLMGPTYSAVTYQSRVADFNEDGDLDFIIVTNAVVGNYLWYENNGDETFTQHVVDASASANHLVLGDINGDGHIDVLGGYTPENILWWENDGTGTFTQHTIPTTYDYPSFFQLVDIDADGDVDLLSGKITYANDNKIYWRENDGDGNFTPHQIEANLQVLTGLDAIDFNQDGYMDIVATSRNQGNIGLDRLVWYENDGNKNFTKHTIPATIDDLHYDYYLPYGQPELDRDIDEDCVPDILVFTYFNYSASQVGLEDIKWFETSTELPTISVAATTSDVTENDGNDLVFRFLRGLMCGAPLTVNFSISGIASDEDITVTTGGVGLVTYDEATNLGTITFPDGERTVELLIQVNDDALVEGTETVKVKLEGAE